IGRKQVDDGVLVLVAKDDRKLRIEVGYGLEGAIPDLYAKRIIAEVIAPYFKQGDIYGGLNAGTDSIISLISGESLPSPAQSANGDESQIEHMLPLLLFGGLIAGGLLRAIFGRFLGGAATGGLIGAAVWILGGGLLFALVLAFIAFILTMSGAVNALGGMVGGSRGFGGGSGGFSGGGGGFGGGGASGDW
ncbi:MAG: TPM domain-containing protein, partial [Methylophilaceae bacterium]